MKRTLSTVTLLALAGGAHAQTIDWANPTGGLWSEPGNWSPAGVPDAPGNTARLGLGVPYEVTLGAPGVGIGSLLVPNPDAVLRISGGATLGLSGPMDNTGRVLVEGGALHAAGDVTVSGTGGIWLSDGAMLTAAPGAKFVTELGSRLIGGGTILAPIELHGSLRAEDPATPLILTGAPKRIEGFIFAEDDCRVEIRDTEIDMTGGILTTYFGEVVCADVTIINGTFDIVLDARMTIVGDTTMSGTVTLGKLRVEPGARLTLRDAPQNAGQMIVNPDNASEAAEIRMENPHEFIYGIGQITLAGEGDRARIVGEPFITTASQRIGGVGLIAAPLTCFGQLLPGLGAEQTGTLRASAPIEMAHPGSILRCDIAAPGDADRLESTSTFVAGGSLLLDLAPGLTATDDWSAVVVHAEGGVSGRFFQVLGPISPDPRRVIRARYTPTEVIVGSACLADMNMSGSLDFFDVAEFVTLYNLRVRDADLAAPFNVWNFFDVAAFIDAYTAGCP